MFDNNKDNMYSTLRELEENIARMKGLEQAKAAQSYDTNKKTVWTDIESELKNCTPEEELFVSRDEDYLQAASQQKASFYQFIEMKYRDEFLQYDRDGISEKTLLALRNARSKYRKELQEKEKKNQEIFQQYNDFMNLMKDPEVAEVVKKKQINNVKNVNK